MPGAAALALISGGSSAMTGIFSSTTARLDSEETLAGGGTSVGFDDAAAAVVVMEGAVPLGLTFSLVAGWEAWGAVCEGRGAGVG